MKHTAKDALKPTVASLMRFLELSNKRHLLITGSLGSGKTTLLNGVVPFLSDAPMNGIVTWAEPRKSVYIKSTLKNTSTQIGVFDENKSACKNRMVSIFDGFLNVGIPAIDSILESDDEWFYVDEIGYLEAGCEAYCHKINELMDKKRLIAVIRKQELPFLNSLLCRDDVCVVDIDDPFGNIGCVIMASGLSKRFGGNKLLADFRGKPLIEWVLDATEGIFAERVVVTRHREIADICGTRNTEFILHSEPYRSDTVRLGIEAVSDATGCVFCPADQPLLSRETMEVMALTATASPNRIWRLSYDGSMGLPVFFPRRFYNELSSLPQGKGGGEVIKKYPEHISSVPARDKYELMDIDTKDDFAFLCRQKEE